MIVGESSFVPAKSRCVVVSASIVMNRRVMDVEHFVEDYVLNDTWRHVRRIERAADDDRVMGRIVVTKDPVGFACGPGQRWLFQRRVKISSVQPVEYLLQIINRPGG